MKSDQLTNRIAIRRINPGNSAGNIIQRNLIKTVAQLSLIVLLHSAINGSAWADAVEDQIACLKDLYARQHAAFLLGRSGDARAVKPLILGLRDPEKAVRESAAESLGLLGDARAVPPLIESLKHTIDLETSRCAVISLLKIGSPAVEPLITCLQDEDAYVRRSAVDALGALGDARAVDPLIGCLKDQKRHIRRSAAVALVKMGTPAVEPLIACLKNEDVCVRALTAKALGALGDKGATQGLVEALPDWDCRRTLGAALEGLGRKPTSYAERVYLWICNSDGANLRAQWEETKEVLLADTWSGNPRKVHNAVYALICLGREEMIPTLIEALHLQGSQEMAETFLFCGQAELAEAACSWTADHGTPLPDAGPAVWGRW